MPTIRLVSGMLTRTENKKRVRYRKGDVVQNVSEKLMSKLRCSIVPDVKKVAEETGLDVLRAKCLSLGIQFQQDWGAKRLTSELKKHGNPDRR
jgi:hypothetical protein